MARYLNIYLLPKTTESNPNPSPLLLTSFSGNTDMYSTFIDNVNVNHIVYDNNKSNYTELTQDVLSTIKDNILHDLNQNETYIKNKTEALNSLKNINQNALDDFIQDFNESKQYQEQLKLSLAQLDLINIIYSHLNYSDFQKILINQE